MSQSHRVLMKKYNNWDNLLLYFTQPFYKVAIVGKSVNEKTKTVDKRYLTSPIFTGSIAESSFLFLKTDI